MMVPPVVETPVAEAKPELKVVKGAAKPRATAKTTTTPAKIQAAKKPVAPRAPAKPRTPKA
jgi:hypothetical protein